MKDEGNSCDYIFLIVVTMEDEHGDVQLRKKRQKYCERLMKQILLRFLDCGYLVNMEDGHGKLQLGKTIRKCCER